jgi:uncharacterized protein
VIRAFLVALTLLVAAPAAAQELPKLTGRVVDNANLLSAAVEGELTKKLEALERRTSDQLVVVTLESLGGAPIEEVGLRLGNGWQIGQADLDNGVLLIVAPSERKTRIEVGYGLEGLLTDELAGEIVQHQLLPNFRSGRYEEGVKDGVNALIRTLESTSTRPLRKQLKKAG